MSIGEAHSSFMGKITKDEAFKLLDTFYESGGNFIDTANNYQDGQSEEWLGEWMESRKVRDQIVLATKYTMSHQQHEIAKTSHGIGSVFLSLSFRAFSLLVSSNYGGMHTKSLRLSLRESLRKLKTDYIDILYVHWWGKYGSIGLKCAT